LFPSCFQSLFSPNGTSMQVICTWTWRICGPGRVHKRHAFASTPYDAFFGGRSPRGGDKPCDYGTLPKFTSRLIKGWAFFFRRAYGLLFQTGWPSFLAG